MTAISDSAAAWEKTGLSFEDRWFLHKNDVTPEQFMDFEDHFHSGELDLDTIFRLVKQDLDADILSSYQTLDFSTEEAIQLKAGGMVPSMIREIRELLSEASLGVDDLLRIRRSGISKSFLVQMRKLGVRNYLMIEKLSPIPASMIADVIKAGGSVDDLFDDDGDPIRALDPVKIMLTKRGLGHLRSFFGHDDHPSDATVAEAQKIYDAGLSKEHFYLAKWFLPRPSLCALGASRVIELANLDWNVPGIRALYGVVFSTSFHARVRMLGDDGAAGFVELAKRIVPSAETTESLARIESMVGGSGFGSGVVIEAMVRDPKRLVEIFKVLPVIRYSGAEYAWQAYQYVYGDSNDPFKMLDKMKVDVEQVGSASMWLSWVSSVSGNTYKNLDRPKTKSRIAGIVAKAAEVRVSREDHQKLSSIGLPEEQMAGFIERVRAKIKVDDDDFEEDE